MISYQGLGLFCVGKLLLSLILIIVGGALINKYNFIGGAILGLGIGIVLGSIFSYIIYTVLDFLERHTNYNNKISIFLAIKLIMAFAFLISALLYINIKIDNEYDSKVASMCVFGTFAGIFFSSIFSMTLYSIFMNQYGIVH